MTTVLESMRRSVGRRHGILLPATTVPRTPADPAGVVHASVPRDDAGSGSAGGGVATDADGAEIAALAEALERYAANVADLGAVPWASIDPADRLGYDDLTLHTSEQRTDPGLADVGYDPEPMLAETWRLHDLRSRWLPASLVGLTDRFGTLSTSSGLAAGPTSAGALLRAIQELVERDAFMVTWLHQLPGREVVMEPIADDVTELGGWLRAFDLTPAWSPHPVAAVLGMVPLEGAPRCSMGLACRGSWSEAVAKAELECLQGVVFAGQALRSDPSLLRLAPGDVVDFDRHAVFHTAHPEHFDELPLLRGAKPAEVPGGVASTTVDEELHHLVTTLAAAGVELFARDLSTIDLHQLGLRVVRVVAPALTPIHHDHRFPFLGGTTADRTWRYPDLAPLGAFPSPHPHPLG